MAKTMMAKHFFRRLTEQGAEKPGSAAFHGGARMNSKRRCFKKAVSRSAKKNRRS